MKRQAVVEVIPPTNGLITNDSVVVVDVAVEAALATVTAAADLLKFLSRIFLLVLTPLHT